MRKVSRSFAAYSRLFAQGGQAYSGRLKAAIGCENLSGDEACPVRAQEDDCLGDLIFAAVSVQRKGIVIGVNYVLGMDGHCEFGAYGTGGYAVCTHPMFAQFNRLLQGQLDDGGF